MAKLPGRKRGRAVSRLAVAAIAAALVGTSASAAVADAPVPAPVKNVDISKLAQAAPKAGAGAKSRATARAAATAEAPVFGLFGIQRSDGFLYQYLPDDRWPGRAHVRHQRLGPAQGRGHGRPQR
ncbi:hypothetical protein SRIMM317S_03005 [Streptomyces rimosus subsp. rimosus]